MGRSMITVKGISVLFPLFAVSSTGVGHSCSHPRARRRRERRYDLQVRSEQATLELSVDGSSDKSKGSLDSLSSGRLSGCVLTASLGGCAGGCELAPSPATQWQIPTQVK